LEDIISPVCVDVIYFELKKSEKITTIMNPPFGSRNENKYADRQFLETAFSFSDVIYSIHSASDKVRNFISKFAMKFNWKIDNVIPYKLRLEKSFQFHQQKVKFIDVEVYRFKKNKK